VNIQLALKDLDKHAFEFNFPALDNAYVDMAATRLTAFKSETDWIIVFEVLGFSNREGIFVDDIYAFGSSLVKEGFISSTPVMDPLPEHPFVDPYTEAWIADWANWAIIVRSKLYKFSPSRDEYIAAGIDVPSEGGPGSLREEQIMRFFIYKEGASELFMQQAELRDELKISAEMAIFAQTEHWQHPDVVGGEKPSDNISIKSLLVALDLNSPSEFHKGRPNTNWKLWDSTSSAD